VTDELGPSAAERRMLRRATATVAAQTAALVAATVLVVSVLAFSLTILSEDAQQEHEVRKAATAAAGVADPPPGVVLVQATRGGPVQVTPGAMVALDPWTVNAGHSHLHRDRRDFEVYAVDAADRRTVALLDVTPRTRAAPTLVGSLIAAAVVGIVAAAVIGVTVGRRAVRPLGEAIALQRRFVADVSHELRTPLAVLHTRAQLLRRRVEQNGTAIARRHAELLVADAQILGDVVDDLLRAAELDHRAGAGQPVDTGRLVRELTASVQPHAADLGIALHAEVGVGKLVVHGVPTSLRRALAALLDNALAHAQCGGTVTVSARRVGAELELTVADDGTGLDPGEAERLQARYARGAKAGDRPGFGLGLALVREVLTAHGGSLAVSGRPGEGATFTMRLPAADPSGRVSGGGRSPRAGPTGPAPG
jgi:signal transduction histidine kinase